MIQTILLGTIRQFENPNASGDVVIQKVKLNDVTMIKIFQRDPQWDGFKAIYRLIDKLRGNRNLTAEFEDAAENTGIDAHEMQQQISTRLRDMKVELSRLEDGSKSAAPFIEVEDFLKQLWPSTEVKKAYVKREEHFLPDRVKKTVTEIFQGKVGQDLAKYIKSIEELRSKKPDHQYSHAEKKILEEAMSKLNSLISVLTPLSEAQKEQKTRLTGLLNELTVRVEENLVGISRDDFEDELGKLKIELMGGDGPEKTGIECLFEEMNPMAKGPINYGKLRYVLPELSRHWKDLSSVAKQELKANLLPKLEEFIRLNEPNRDDHQISVQLFLVQKLHRTMVSDS